MARTLGLALCLVLVLAAPGAAAVPERWGPAETLGGWNGRGYDGPSIAATANGHRAVAFASDGDYAAVATARDFGPFGRTRRVPNSKLADYDLADEPFVAIDERGNALVVWSYEDPFRAPDDEAKVDEGCCRPLRFTVLRANGRFDPVRRLTPRGRDVALGDLAIEDGRVAITWIEERDVNGAQKPGVLLYLQEPGGGRGTTRVIDPRGSRALAVSFVRGRARVLYEQATFTNVFTPTRYDLREAAERPDGTLGPSRLVAEQVPHSFVDLQVATARNGRQALVYKTGSSDGASIHAGTRSPGRPFALRRVAGPAEGLDDPQVAATATWGSSEKPSLSSALARPGAAFGAVRAPFRRRKPDGPSDLRLAVGPRGGSVMTWVDQDTDTIRTGFVGPDGRAGPASVLAHDPGDSAILAPDLVTDDSGRALTVYTERGFVKVRRARLP